MTDLLLDLIPTWVWIIIAIAALFGAWRYLGFKGMLGLLAAIATVGAYRHGRQTREHEEAVRRAQEQLAGAKDRLEMHREATEAERQARDLPDAEARKEALKWARK